MRDHTLSEQLLPWADSNFRDLNGFSELWISLQTISYAWAAILIGWSLISMKHEHTIYIAGIGAELLCLGMVAIVCGFSHVSRSKAWSQMSAGSSITEMCVEPAYAQWFRGCGGIAGLILPVAMTSTLASHMNMMEPLFGQPLYLAVMYYVGLIAWILGTCPIYRLLKLSLGVCLQRIGEFKTFLERENTDWELARSQLQNLRIDLLFFWSTHGLAFPWLGTFFVHANMCVIAAIFSLMSLSQGIVPYRFALLFLWAALVTLRLLQMLASITSACDEATQMAWNCKGQESFSQEQRLSHLRFTAYASMNPAGAELLGVRISWKFVVETGIKLLAVAPAAGSALAATVWHHHRLINTVPPTG